MLIDVSIIIPTCDRVASLTKTLDTVALQNYQPAEIIIVDASENTDTKKLCEEPVSNLRSKIKWVKAEKKGAALQRNQAMESTTMPFIGFMDDDVYLEPFCIERVWNCFQVHKKTGGVNALIINQQFQPVGRLSKVVYSLFASKQVINNLEGKIIGPAINFLSSEKNKDEFIRVYWLNLGLTIYRREVLPVPVFNEYFTGYSFMEDVALSLTVGRNWELYTVRDARIFHDSQPGEHKKNIYKLAVMQTVNRYYIMTNILQKKNMKAKAGFYFYMFFQIFAITGSPLSFKIKVNNILGIISALFKPR